VTADALCVAVVVARSHGPAPVDAALRGAGRVARANRIL